MTGIRRASHAMVESLVGEWVSVEDIKTVLKKRYETWDSICDAKKCYCPAHNSKEEIKDLCLQLTGEDLE